MKIDRKCYQIKILILSCHVEVVKVWIHYKTNIKFNHIGLTDFLLSSWTSIQNNTFSLLYVIFWMPLFFSLELILNSAFGRDHFELKRNVTNQKYIVLSENNCYYVFVSVNQDARICYDWIKWASVKRVDRTQRNDEKQKRMEMERERERKKMEKLERSKTNVNTHIIWGSMIVVHRNHPVAKTNTHTYARQESEKRRKSLGNKVQTWKKNKRNINHYFLTFDVYLKITRKYLLLLCSDFISDKDVWARPHIHTQKSNTAISH